MITEAKIHFAAGHPAAAGHFPGNPIIPGALLLDEVLRILQAETGFHVALIRAAKFLAPVRPGETIIATWQRVAGGGVKFECRCGATLVAAGTVERLETAA